MKTISPAILSILMLFVISGCGKDTKPVFKSVIEQNFSGVQKKTAKYSAYVVFENIGSKSYTVENLVADLIVDGKDACTIYFKGALEIKPGSEVKIPVRQSFDTKGIFESGADGYPNTVKTELKGALKLKSSDGDSAEVSFFSSESIKINTKKEKQVQEENPKKLNRKEKRAARKAEQ